MIEKYNGKSFIITFQNETQLLKFEKFIIKKYKYKIVPIPRSISAGCGLCIKANVELKDEFTHIIEENNVKHEKILEIK